MYAYWLRVFIKSVARQVHNFIFIQNCSLQSKREREINKATCCLEGLWSLLHRIRPDTYSTCQAVLGPSESNELGMKHKHCDFFQDYSSHFMNYASEALPSATQFPLVRFCSAGSNPSVTCIIKTWRQITGFSWRTAKQGGQPLKSSHLYQRSDSRGGPLNLRLHRDCTELLSYVLL